MLERSREDVFEKGLGGMRTLTPPCLESCLSEAVQRKALTWDKAAEVWNSRPDTDFFVCKARRMNVLSHCSSKLGGVEVGGCLAPEEGVAAEGLRLCSGVESPENFPGGREKDARRGRSSASGHPFIRFSLPVSSFLSLEGLKTAEGELKRSKGPRAGRKNELVSSLGPRGRAGVSGVNSPTLAFFPKEAEGRDSLWRGRSQRLPDSLRAWRPSWLEC